MIRLPEDLRAQLLANGQTCNVDHVPVLKLFNPVGPATWLATELAPDGDTLFGLADLGFGCPELGDFSLSELSSVRAPLGRGSNGTDRCWPASRRRRRSPRVRPAWCADGLE